MSRRQIEEMKQLATRVAVEATGRERHRCLWVLDRMVAQAQAGLETQLAQVRFDLTKAIVSAAKVLIMSDARPQAVRVTPAPGQATPPHNDPPTQVIQ
jgi:F0F1-type ATP synthase membrane subunit b/b'